MGARGFCYFLLALNLAMGRSLVGGPDRAFIRGMRPHASATLSASAAGHTHTDTHTTRHIHIHTTIPSLSLLNLLEPLCMIFGPSSAPIRPVAGWSSTTCPSKFRRRIKPSVSLALVQRWRIREGATSLGHEIRALNSYDCLHVLVTQRILSQSITNGDSCLCREKIPHFQTRKLRLQLPNLGAQGVERSNNSNIQVVRVVFVT
jgi:hypothetical protein